MLTANEIQKVLNVSRNKSYTFIKTQKKKHNLKYPEARISRKIVKDLYGLTDREIDERLNT